MSRVEIVLEEVKTSKKYSKASIAAVAECPEHREQRGFESFADSLTLVKSSDRFASSTLVRSLALVLTDLIATLLALATAYFLVPVLRTLLDIPQELSIASHSSVLMAFAVPLCSILWFSYSWGHYTRVKAFWDETRDLLKMLIYSAVIVIFLLYLQKAHASRIWIGSSYMLLLLFCPIARSVAKKFLNMFGMLHVPLIVVGHGHRLDSLMEAINSDYSLGYRVAVLIDIDNLEKLTTKNKEVNTSRRLVHGLKVQYPTAHLLLALGDGESTVESGRMQEIIVRSFNNIVIARPMHGLSTVNSEILTIEKFDTLFVRLANLNKPVARIYKRAFDLALSVFLLVLLSPLLAVIAAVSKLDGGSIFYGSARIGKGGKKFKCYKFRSMYEDADLRLENLLATDDRVRKEWQSSFKLKNDPRISPLGNLLRKTSLDELPQLWNIIVGDMSLVGPRPILPDERPHYGSSLTDYEMVRPGLTGLWQVSGRSSLSYQKRAQLNLWYLRNWSLWLDFVILLKTIPAVLSSKHVH